MTDDKARRDRRAGVIGVLLLLGFGIGSGLGVILAGAAVLKAAIVYLFT